MGTGLHANYRHIQGNGGLAYRPTAGTYRASLQANYRNIQGQLTGQIQRHAGLLCRGWLTGQLQEHTGRAYRPTTGTYRASLQTNCRNIQGQLKGQIQRHAGLHCRGWLTGQLQEHTGRAYRPTTGTRRAVNMWTGLQVNYRTWPWGRKTAMIEFSLVRALISANVIQNRLRII